MNVRLVFIDLEAMYDDVWRMSQPEATDGELVADLKLELLASLPLAWREAPENADA